MDWDKVSADLSKKLEPAHVHPPKPYGPKGDYIEGWHAIAEANRIFGFGAWSYELRDCKCVSDRQREIGQAKKSGFGVTYTARVVVQVGGVTREDVGAGHGYDVDCGLAHESAIKEAVTDALKRALRSFGNPFGLALYDKSRDNVGVDAPSFDPRAATDRIIAKIRRTESVNQLSEEWKDEAAAIASVKRESPPMFAEINAAKDTRKNELTEGRMAAE